MASVAYGSLPFQQQITFFRNKKDVLTESWVDVWESQHDNAFMVAGANRAEIVADFRDAIRKAIEDGATLEEFRRDFDRIVTTHGWDYKGGRNWRSRIIYETNLRQSYNAGRWKQLQALKKAMPFWRYRHNDAVQHPRPLHVSWDGQIWAADDPVWQVLYPANGWGCQCYVEALSRRDLERLGKSGPDTPPQLQWKDVLVGQRSPGGPRLVRTVDGVDPGFAYAPGSSLDGWPQRRGGPVTPPALQRTLEQSTQDLLRKSTRLPATAAAELLKEAMALPRAINAIDAGFASFLATSDEAGGASYFIGAFDDAVLDALGTRQVTPGTVAIAVRATTAKRLLDIGQAAARELPSWLRTPRAVLWHAAAGEVLYVAETGTGVAVARVGVRGAPVVQSITTADMADLSQRLREGTYTLLQGSLE